MAVIDSNFVDQVLGQIEEKEKEALKEVLIEKELVDVDLGNCLLIDNNPLDEINLRKIKEDYLLKLAQTNGQYLLNKLSELDTMIVDGYNLIKLPVGTTPLPRSMPVPKPKAPTKWETYAKDKGIQKRKREKMVWDDTEKVWKPRYGYNRINSDKDDWIIEIPQNKDENTDMFAEVKEAKRERVAKNEFQRLRNIARANKIKATGLTPVLPKDGKELETRDEVMNAAAVARVATASLGKFDKKLKNGLDKIETKLAAKAARVTGKKRKFEPNLGNMDAEKKKYSDILSKIDKGDKIDGTRALNIINQKKINSAVKNDDKKTKGKDRKSKKGKKAGKRVAYHNKSQQRKKSATGSGSGGSAGRKGSFKGKSKGGKSKGK
ncbi:ribosome biogenesis regulatory protein homolog [Panonychus citri]|uniref:ribosome biogenesis regulatory protein homolog n=1 Tax=Panonychus citri TaxID=50023 RepID=UPI002307A2CD|nr:ribosome biogenesis regulatory protein homolog [Panonychus citri]